jgi:hypothetical protein
MLVDFLKGNHLLKSIATVLWLWESKEPAFRRWVILWIRMCMSHTYSVPVGICLWAPAIGQAGVTAPILRLPDEGTLGAKKHLEAHFDKLLKGGGVKVTLLVGFRLLSHPLSHLGVLQAPAY